MVSNMKYPMKNVKFSSPAFSLFLYILAKASARTSGFHRFTINQNGIDHDKSKEVCAEWEMDTLIESQVQLAIALTSK